MNREKGVFVLFLFASLSCRPRFEERESLVTGPRVLALRAEPPESSPGQTATYRALVATPEGEAQAITFQWSFCAAPKPLTENNSVSAACLGDQVRPLEGVFVEIQAATPTDACELFGPDTPPGDFRPRDADETGGFYQPLRLRALGQTAFGLERITCNLPNAPLDVAVDLTKRYVPNRNPTLLPIHAQKDGEEISPTALAAGEDVVFEVSWAEADAEAFLAFDPNMQSLSLRREAMRVSWFATAGAFEHDVTGRTEEDESTSTSNPFRAPAEPGPIFLWIVLRDSRGGLDFAGYTIDVQEP